MSASRNIAILRAYRAGASEVELARTYGVSRQRISQIVLRVAERQEHSLEERRRAFEQQRDIAHHQLGALFAQRKLLNERIRGALTKLRIAQEELGSMEVDAVLRL